MITRRGLFEAAVGAVAFGLLWLLPLLPAGTRAEAALETIAVKKPLIRLTERRPNYEAPLSYLRTPITPNVEFFVRYLSPAFRKSTPAHGRSPSAGRPPMATSRSAYFEVTAVCQCAGNRRGLFQPHIPGVQWGYGAMGCTK